VFVCPEGHDADNFRKVVLEISTCRSARPQQDQGQDVPDRPPSVIQRSDADGHAIGVEMGLDLAKVPHRTAVVLAAMEVLKGRDVVQMRSRGGLIGS